MDLFWWLVVIWAICGISPLVWSSIKLRSMKNNEDCDQKLYPHLVILFGILGPFTWLCLYVGYLEAKRAH